MKRDPLIEAAARATHEANRAWCIHNGDHSQLPWDTAPEWQRDSARKGVIGVIRDGNSPRESHASWLAEKESTGWRYGPNKDVEKREHPCMVPYDDLPPAQRAKDRIFVNIVCAFREAFNALPLLVFSDGTSWVVARTPYDALTALCEYTGERVSDYDERDEDFKPLDPGKLLTIDEEQTGDAPNVKASKTCAEWAAGGRRYLAGENY